MSSAKCKQKFANYSNFYTLKFAAVNHNDN